MDRPPADSALPDGLRVLRLNDRRFRRAPLDPSTASELSCLLATKPTIEKLHVHYCQSSLGALELVLGGLADNDTLESLNISPISIVEDGDGEEIFTKLFKTKLYLKHLSLEGCPIRRTGVIALAAMLKTNKTLQVLKISKTLIHHLEVHFIARALKKNQTLLELHLSPLLHGQLYADQLANALRSNSTLEILRLEGYRLYDEGAIQLADALHVNCTVKVLSLKDCRIGGPGAVALGRAIRKNDVLEELNLENNDVSELGGQELLLGLQHNRRLKKITFACLITKDLAVALGKMIRENDVLEEVNLQRTCGGELSEQEILDWLEHNRRLKRVTLDTSPASSREKLDFWLRLTPCGRAILKEEGVSSSLLSKVLHRIDQDGGVDSVHIVIRERPDLVTRQCRTVAVPRPKTEANNA